MLHNKLIDALGAKARIFIDISIKRTTSKDLKIPADLAELLSHFKGSIIFTRGAKFKTQSKIPVRDKEDYIDLDIIYGLASDSNNIFLKNQVYANQIDQNLYVFGESESGDQFCLSKATGEVYYWYHEAKHENETTFLIAKNFKDFIMGLRPDEELPATEKKKK
ncbi:SMI1/KNR4 family protein [Pseudomonas sp. NPDC087346]|uniref:SMI1/KNR4 family protein n=1 Tax=Pseudomonas sp. NPDC087346 TaxID=3364438 RepID=UPI0037FB4DF5